MVGLVAVPTLCSIASVLVHHLVEREGPLHVAVGRHWKVPVALSACCADSVVGGVLRRFSRFLMDVEF